MSRSSRHLGDGLQFHGFLDRHSFVGLFLHFSDRRSLDAVEVGFAGVTVDVQVARFVVLRLHLYLRPALRRAHRRVSPSLCRACCTEKTRISAQTGTVASYNGLLSVKKNRSCSSDLLIVPKVNTDIGRANLARINEARGRKSIFSMLTYRTSFCFWL